MNGECILPLTTESMYSTFRKTVDSFCSRNPDVALLDLYTLVVRNVDPKFHDVFQAAYFVALDHPKQEFWHTFWQQLDAFFPKREHSTLKAIREIESLKYSGNAAEVFTKARRMAVGLPAVPLHDHWVFETLISLFPAAIAGEALVGLKVHHQHNTRAEVFDWLEEYIVTREAEANSKPRCTYCQKQGHTRQSCRRLSAPTLNRI